MEIWVVMAAYNEEKSIAHVIKDLKKNGFKNIAAVDDGSKDNTLNEAKKAGATTLQHVINRGQGASLQTGISYVLGRGAGIIITFDSDGQHQVKDVKKMLKLVQSGKYDFVLGSRFLKGAGQIPFGRKFLLFGSMILQRVLWGLPLSDAHNGLRVMNRKAASVLKITSDRMEHSSQMAEQLIRSGLKYKEVPIDVIYTDETMQKGHGGFIQAIKVLFTFFWRKLIK